jgi:Putative rhamnosyl transferase
MPVIQHLLETRFSVLPRFTAEWLAERLELVRRFSLPSVAAQTTEAFTWLLLCDETTDRDILEQLGEEERGLSPLRVVLTRGEERPLSPIRKAVRPDADVLITTRLDSDDAIADEYLAAIQDYASSFHRSSHNRLLVNFPRGYRLDARADRLYRGWMHCSPFHSLFERPKHAAPDTVMSFGRSDTDSHGRPYLRLGRAKQGNTAGHPRLHYFHPTHQDTSMDAWLIAIHGGNRFSGIPHGAQALPAGSRPAGFTLGDAVPQGRGGSA